MTRLELTVRWLSFVAAVGSCHPVTPIDPDPPVVGTCFQAGERLRELGCPEATTPAGEPFEAACEAAKEDGRDLCPGEIAQILSCDEVESAYRRCQ